MASTNFMTSQETASQLTVIWSPNLVQHGPWSCLGAPSIAHCPLSRWHHSRSTLQWTRIATTGNYTVWVWHEWDPCRVTPLTGEQHAVTQLTAWISPTTFAESLKTLISSITVGVTNAREWNTSTFGDTLESSKRFHSGRGQRLEKHFYIPTVLLPPVNLSRILVRSPPKTTSGITTT